MTTMRMYAKCEECGIEFEIHHHSQKYCSEKCQRLSTNKRKREHYRETHESNSRKMYKCAVCGEAFEPRNCNQKYCSEACKTVRDKAYARDKFRRTHEPKYPCEKTCINCNHKFIAFHARTTRCPACQLNYDVERNIEYQHERYLRERTSEKPYQPQTRKNQFPDGLTDKEYAFKPKKIKPVKRKRTPQENEAIIDEKIRKSNALNIDYGEYDACLRQGIDPAAYAARRQPYQSYEERAWLEHIFSITGKI